MLNLLTFGNEDLRCNDFVLAFIKLIIVILVDVVLEHVSDCEYIIWGRDNN